MESCVPFGDEGCRSGWRRLTGVLAVASALLLGWATPAHAATFVVRNTADSGHGSLRDAITRADANSRANTITFGVSGTITLASSLPAVTGDLVVAGPGPGAITIDGDHRVQVWSVAPAAKLWLGGVTIADGNAPTRKAVGGIENAGSLIVSGVAFAGNTGQNAGAAIENLGTAVISNSTLTRNDADVGGAIFNAPSATLTMSRVTLARNNGLVGSGWSAGAIANSGTLSIANSSFRGNNAGDYGTGGIWNTRHATLQITNTRFAGNLQIYGDGGESAITNGGGSVTIDHSSFVGNASNWGDTIRSVGTISVSDSSFLGNFGTGVENDGGTLQVTGSTFWKNDTEITETGGIANYGRATVVNSTFFGLSVNIGGLPISNSGQMRVTASTIDRSMIENDGTLILQGSIVDARCAGRVADAGYNLDARSSCHFTAPGSISDTDPMLQRIAYNGGPTPTMAIPASSPAVDAIPPGAISCGTTLIQDQRGVSRPQGGGCDIGAYELGAALR